MRKGNIVFNIMKRSRREEPTLQGCELLVGSNRGLWKAAQSFVRPPSGTVTYRKWPAMITIRILLLIFYIPVCKKQSYWHEAQYGLCGEKKKKTLSNLLRCCWNDPCLVPSEDQRGRCSPDSSWPTSVWTGKTGPSRTGPHRSHSAWTPLKITQWSRLQTAKLFHRWGTPSWELNQRVMTTLTSVLWI